MEYLYNIFNILKSFSYQWNLQIIQPNLIQAFI